MQKFVTPRANLKPIVSKANLWTDTDFEFADGQKMGINTHTLK